MSAAPKAVPEVRVHATTACLPGMTTLAAVERLMAGLREPAFDAPLCTEHVQICPQSIDVLSDALIDELRQRYPKVNFRLHGPARVVANRPMCDLRWSPQNRDYYEALARASRRLGASGYTFHAYFKPQETRQTVAQAVRELTDLFEHPVGVEAMYPGDRSGPREISTWDDYRWLLDSGLWFAIDVSHANILARASGVRGEREEQLIADMIASERCLEVHVAGNDGRRDAHDVLVDRPWWWACLEDGLRCRRQALIFSEGNQLRKRS